jgi:hypothetical protein
MSASQVRKTGWGEGKHQCIGFLRRNSNLRLVVVTFVSLLGSSLIEERLQKRGHAPNPTRDGRDDPIYESGGCSSEE